MRRIIEHLMIRSLSITVVTIVVATLCGCAETIPITYTPQNYVRYQGQVDIGQFTYEPSTQGEVKPNQLQNTAIGSVYISTDIADLVQRATALELEKTGFQIGDTHPLQVSGDVLEFKANDLGYSVGWTYSIRYKIVRKADSTTLLNKVYTADPKKTGKFNMPSDYGPSVNEMILAGYDMFIRDDEVRKILGQ